MRRRKLLLLLVPIGLLLLMGAGVFWWWKTGYPILFQGERYTFLPEVRGDLCPRREPNLRDVSSVLPDIPHLVTPQGHVLPCYRTRSYTYSTNSEMFRGSKELARSKRAGVFRIVVLGTGVTFGNGVDDRFVYPAMLEKMLRKHGRPGEREFEVLNMGRAGAVTDEGLKLLRRIAAEMEFDLAIFCFGVNDGLPMFDRSPQFYDHTMRQIIELRRQHGFQMLYMLEPRSTFYPWPYETYEKYFWAAVNSDRESEVLNLPKILDAVELSRGLRLVKEGNVQRVVQYREGNPRVLFETTFDRQAAIKQYANKVHTLRIVDRKGKLRWHKEKMMDPSKGIQSVSPEVYDFLDTHDVYQATMIDGVHPNEEGHSLVAQSIYSWLKKKGIVE